ncbi:MAG: GNAT family N-acetyltransferase [Candidatus Bathyarchaeota archaeon]|nr:GNAT family N-acetyltransferase [Candidatus Bathyarchaeota archaeon]
MNIVLRRARPEDREKVAWVESKSTPNLSYTPYVYDMFVDDRVGEFSVEEIDGELVACGKYTIVPDGSAWIETLRVIPEKQGLGLGKRLYEHWLELAKAQGVKAMRMYTGETNVVSSGLAERYGLTLQGTFKSNTLPARPGAGARGGFVPVPDAKEAIRLLMPLEDEWADWLVMNRTFYRLSPALCEDMAKRGMVYTDPKTKSVVTLGARFMPEQALHIGVWGGDADACIDFAKWKATERGIPQLSCFYEVTRPKIGEALARHGFKVDSSDYIVKGIYLN